MDYTLPHIFEPDGSKGINDEPLCKCGLNNTYSIHSPELVKEYFPTPPVNESWQGRFMRKLDELVHQSGLEKWDGRLTKFIIDAMENILSTARQEAKAELVKEIRKMKRIMVNPVPETDDVFAYNQALSDVCIKLQEMR